MGFHYGLTTYGTAMQPTAIAHVHYQNKPYRTAQLQALEIEGACECHDMEAVKNYRGPGEHLTKVLLSVKVILTIYSLKTI